MRILWIYNKYPNIHEIQFIVVVVIVVGISVVLSVVVVKQARCRTYMCKTRYGYFDIEAIRFRFEFIRCHH